MKIDWQEISRQHGPLVWRTAYRLLNRDADAADCFQETFLSALDVSNRQEVLNWPGLLTRLATTRALDQLRRRKRDLRLRQGTEPDWERVESEQLGPDRRAQDAELMDNLRAAIARLPEQQAEVFCLRHLNGLSYEEIADELRISVDGVGVSLHRAKARLRQLLVSACTAEEHK